MSMQENQHPPASAGRGHRAMRRGAVAVIVAVLASGVLALQPATAQRHSGGPDGRPFPPHGDGRPGGRPFPPHGDVGRPWSSRPKPPGGWRHAPPPHYGRPWSDHRRYYYYYGWGWPWFWLSSPLYYSPWPPPYPYYEYEPDYGYEPDYQRVPDPLPPDDQRAPEPATPPPEYPREPEPMSSPNGWSSR